MVPYAVGVNFANASFVGTESALVKITGDSCNLDETADYTGTCVKPVELPLNTHQEAPVGITAYRFTLPKTSLTGSFSFACANNSVLEYSIRRDGSAANVNAVACGQPAVNFPRNGQYGYYLLVNNSQAATQGFQIAAVICTNETGGPDCKTTVTMATAVPRLTLLMEEVHYFKVNATVAQQVWVNARAVNGSQETVVNPIVMASLNQLPQFGDADIGACTQFYCQYVNVIQFNVSENQTWYIGIRNLNLAQNDSTVGVWFNSICAPDCQDHGTCAQAGPKQGFCNCIDGFIGVDCNTPNGFGPQFIVLIIIAVLVALTAVIGFGAWAYMRRKRGQYDIVS